MAEQNQIDQAKKIIADSKEMMDACVEFFDEDLKTYRAGKANLQVFNTVLVNYYGTMTPVPQMSSVSSPDAKTILIQPWEKSQIQAIEKAIMAANLGYNPQNNGEVIRITIPALTEERRRELVKTARTSGEEQKVNIRNERRDAIEKLKNMKKSGLPEDLEADGEDDIQKATNDSIKKIDDLLSLKEKEIMTV
ncbi:MAG: ribosome recycling factor [Bacteroidales bacterium]|jgi:ribosome recycling factor|nr:ribosome recycling factor [Bacteroidales bacterium]MCI2121097.1 ribosome recycling factor [Bacteroidales bacterium]MCI2144912.1 ribosome recycling factor [Bacteroidales bacterium]